MHGVLAAALLAAAMTLQLQSSDFSPGGVIPTRAMALECGGQNRSPQLTWSPATPNVKSFALIVHDPDAPLAGGYYHWVVYNLSAGTHMLAAGAKLGGDQLGVTSGGKAGYYGPCPPPGPAHHYIFTLYALGLPRIAASSPLTAAELQRRIAGHVIAKTMLEGVAARR
jgi:Raf kinase inhibitor-like YbhB/YbcL family protein